MFDGDQLHQFIASSRASLPIPLSFPLHGNPSFSTPFDPYHHLHHHHHEPPPLPSAAAKNNIMEAKNLGLESERSMDPWSNDELLALLRHRSSMEAWLPDFTWEHVSRKLADHGFKRTADECKEKFEEESRHFNSVKSYRILTELDELYPGEEGRASGEKGRDVELVDHAETRGNSTTIQEISGNINEADKKGCGEEDLRKSRRKRKRKDKVEMFKGFCEGVVKRMMAQQEELHTKLIDEIVKRDEEKIAREEAWKNQEIDRVRMEIEMRSKEQESAAKRQASIIHFLKKFMSQDQNLKNKIDDYLVINNNNSSNSCNTTHDQQQQQQQQPATTTNTPPPSPSPTLITTSSHEAKTELGGSDVGKRWPRDEVMALINLRCKTSSNEQETTTKGPLWERISQGMMEMGYKRSAKRCKEKWENINKYFRKTKDNSKKRSVNSRTCPYFHHLTSLYNQGTIVPPNQH